MSANQARHRIVPDESGATTVNRFWAAKELLDRAQPTGSPRHMQQQASNRYLSVGRVGALAVSLGIGFALYTSATGVAFAAETGSSSTGADGSDGGQPEASDHDNKDDRAGSAQNKESDENGADAADNAGGDDDDVTADVDDNTGAELDGHGSADEDEQEPGTAIVDSDADEPQAGFGGPDTPLRVSGADKPGDHDDAPTGPQDETPPPATVDTLVAEPPASIAPALESTQPEGAIPPEAVEVAVLAPVEESVEETEVIRMAVSNVISPLLNTGNPIQSALTDTLLAWVRRLINHTFFNKTPVISEVTTSEFLGTRMITINATDPNGDPLTYEVVTGPSKGVLVPGLVAGTFTYVPNPLELLGGPYTETVKFRVRDDSEHLTGVYGTIQAFLENVARRLGLAKADTVETKEITFAVGTGDIELGLPPLVTASGGKTYRLGSSGIAPITSVSINDIDSDYVTGAIVSVKTDDLLFSKFIAGDKLSFTDTAEITGVYDENTGVLTLSGRATKAAYEAALESVTFTATQVVERFLGLGFVGRTLSIVVTDDTDVSNSLFPARASVAVAKAARGAAPTVTLSGTPTYPLGGSGVAALQAVTINDADSTMLSGATVTVKSSALFGSFISGDVLNFTDTAQIIGSYDTSSGALTLTGNATLAQYKTALESVTFTGTRPGGLFNALQDRTVAVTITDDTSLVSAAATASVKVANPAAPSVSLSGAPTFILGKPAVSALPSVTITDSDSTTLSGAKVTVKTSGLFGVFVSGDKLNFVDANGITGNYNTSTGVLTLSGNATVSQYKAALEAVTFSATQGGGLLGALSDRTIVVTVTDEISRTSDEALSSVNMANPVTPSVSLSGTTTFVLGYSNVVALPSVTISDSDSPMLSGAKVTVRKDDLLFPDYVSGDTLNFTNQNGISIVSNTNGVLTLAGEATLAHYKAALESITFSATQVIDGLLGGTVSRNLTVTVTDELGLTSDAKTGTVKVVRPTAPSASVSGATPTYTVGMAGVIVLPTVTITDSESTTLTKATVTVRKNDFLFPDFVSGDKLNFTNQNGITGVYNTNTGVLTLTGTASLANYTTALQSVTFTATQVIDGLISGTVGRTITFTVTDETNLTSDSSSASVNVVRSVAPTVSLAGGSQTVVLGKTGVAVLPTVSITDSDSMVLTGAKVKVTAAPALIPVYISGDTFNFTGQNGISIVSNSGGVLTLTGNATVAHYKAALESITFSATSPGGLFGALLDRTFTVTVTDDSTATSNEVSRTVDVANPVLPTVSVSGPVPTFIIGKSTVTALPTVTMSDSDSSTLSKATVTVKTDDGIFSTVVGGDVLGFNNTNPWGIAGSYSNGVLTLTGNASLANYTSALQSVTFSATQNTANRALTVTVTATDDLNQASDTASATVKVAFPAPPTLSVSGATPTYLFGRSGVKLLPAVTIGDSDSVTLSGARVTVVGTILGIPSSFVSGDALGFTNQNGISIASNTNGVLTLTGTATLAQYKTALESITFSATQGGGAFGAFVDRAVTITVTDETNRTSGEVSRSVKVDNPAPATVSVSGSTPTFLIGRAGVVALPSVTINDSDSAEIAGAKVSVKTDEFFPTVVASDVLGFNNFNAWGITGSYSGGVLALTGTASVTNYQLALMSITFSTSADTTDRKLTITVTGADDQGVASSEASRTVKVSTTVTPTVSPSGTTPTFYLTKSSPLIALPGVTVGDPDSPLLSGASVTVKAGSTVVGSDILTFNNSNAWGITGTFSNGVMSLTGSASAANYQAALQSITFAATTNTTTRTLTVTVTSPDDTTSTATATASIAVSNPVAPTVTLSGTDLIQLFGPSSTVILDGAARTVIGEATINDPDSTTMSKAVVMVRTSGGSLISSDALAFTPANGITVQSNTSGVLTLVGNATKAAYKAALESITLKVVDGGGLFGAPTGRTVSVTLTDELGSTGATSTVSVSVNLF